MQKLKQIEQLLTRLTKSYPQGISAQNVAESLSLDRSTASRYLNQLVQTQRAKKIQGRPVRYIPLEAEHPSDQIRDSFPHLIGIQGSLQPIAKEALAACMYPPQGLPILLTGETGVGKSTFAQSLDQAIRSFRPTSHSPFISFNCAAYAQNPELLMAQLFGVQKGAFTGATKDKPGLVERADKGILFLDEIHRLPPAGQEMLFHLIDQGIYRRLGESEAERSVQLLLIGATTESPDEVLLPTLYRRFSVKLRIPPMRMRPRQEREAYLNHFLAQEQNKVNVPLSLSAQVRTLLLDYECPGNLGQLKSDIQIACAHAFLRQMNKQHQQVKVQIDDLPSPLREPTAVDLQRLIVTLCLADDGTAISMKHWLAEHLPSEDQDVIIHPIEIDESLDETAMYKQIEQLSEQYDLISIIGTTPIEVADIPFISALDVYQSHGLQQLKRILQSTRKRGPSADKTALPSIIYQGLLETVTHLNPQRFVDVMTKETPMLREIFSWDNEKEIGIWMHLGIYTDQLLKNQLKHPQITKEEPTHSPAQLPIHTQLWSQLLKKLEETFLVHYPILTAKELTRLSK